jgi:hypothetical protein
MAGSVATQTRDFARRFFAVVSELGREDWVSANEAFERTITAHPDHPYVAYIRASRVRRAGFAAAAEHVRQAKFPQIERRKAGTRRNAPVFYRVARPDMSFRLNLPYQVPPSHPLRTASDARSAWRRDPETAEAGSPWRRRQRSRRPTPDAPTGWAAMLFWWQGIADAALDLLETASRAVFKPIESRRRP